MNLEKFTDRAKGFLQAAQTIAIRMNHQQIAPEHIAKALLEDNQGMAAGLIQRAGGDPARPVQAFPARLAKPPASPGPAPRRPRGPKNTACALQNRPSKDGRAQD